MALPPPNLPAVSLIRAHYSGPGGITAMNVWHVLSSGASALDVFNRFTTAWDAGQMAHTSSAVRLHTLDVMRLDNLTATETFTTVGAKFAGTVAEDVSPAVCLLLRYTTGFRGLAGQGNTHAPFVVESVQTNGQVDAAALPGLSAAWVSWVNSLTTQGLPLQIVSPGRETANSSGPAAPATSHSVTAVAMSPVLATQRNRQGRLFG